MTVREAIAGDAEAVGPLLLKCCAQHEAWDAAKYGLTENVIREYRRWFGQIAEDPRTFLLVAEDGKKVVGFLIAAVRREAPIYRLKEYALIQELWVEPEYHGTGVGRDLINAAAAMVRPLGITQMRAETAASNEPLRKMLESCGFRTCMVDLLLELPPSAPKRRRPRAAGARAPASNSTSLEASP